MCKGRQEDLKKGRKAGVILFVFLRENLVNSYTFPSVFRCV